MRKQLLEALEGGKGEAGRGGRCEEFPAAVDLGGKKGDERKLIGSLLLGGEATCAPVAEVPADEEEEGNDARRTAVAEDVDEDELAAERAEEGNEEGGLKEEEKPTETTETEEAGAEMEVEVEAEEEAEEEEEEGAGRAE